jgi:hypothetical protein
LGASYDDHFFGGFDELLPNDLAEKVNGEALIDHGELWTTPLRAFVEGETLALEGQLPITPLAYRKTLRLSGNSLVLDYRLSNQSRKPLDLLWKLHPALRVTPGAEIDVPARRARAADPDWSRVKDTSEFPWDTRRNLHSVGALDGSTEFLYLLDLERGRCGLSHAKENWAFHMSFDEKLFSSVWIFASFGGWRDLELLILEPCTTPQLSLAECSKTGACLHLVPGEVIETRVQITAGWHTPAD